MAENKNGFILYADQKEILDELTNEQVGELFKTIFAYVNDLDPAVRDDIKFPFIAFKSRLRFDLKKWEKTSIARSEAGKKGAEARWKKDD